MKLEELYSIISQRKKELPEDSYVASLFRKGEDAILQKIGEEAIEVIIAAKNKNKQQIIYEVADLWFHLFVLLVANNISIKDIDEELEKRN